MSARVFGCSGLFALLAFIAPATAAEPITSISSVEATYGASSVNVFFTKLPDKTASATITIKTCREEKPHKFTDDELKAVKVSVALDRGLFCSDPGTATIVGTPAQGGAATDPATRQFTPAKIQLTVLAPLREGDQKVTGRAVGATKVRVYEYPGSCGSGASPANTALQRSDDVDVTNGAWTANLDRRLLASTCVTAEPLFSTDATLAPGMWSPSGVEVQSVEINVGRVNGYFSIGGMVSQYQQNFSQVNAFIGFTTDFTLGGMILDKDKMGIPRRNAGKTKAAQVAPASPQTDGDSTVAPQRIVLRDGLRFHVNSFADARVGVKLADSAATATTAPQTASATATPPPATPPTQVEFLSTQPGFFQFGVHMPLSWAGMDWVHQGQVYSAFIAPIVKVGAATYDKNLILSRQVQFDLTQADDAKKYTILAQDKRGGALPFYGLGGRIGVMGYTMHGSEARNRQVGTNLLAYLDVTYGQDKSFPSYTIQRYKSLADKTPVDLSATQGIVNISSAIEPRISVEGRFKIPYLPALVGVDANVRTNSRSEEPNLLRFVVAFRVDAQSALSRVFGSIK